MSIRLFFACLFFVAKLSAQDLYDPKKITEVRIQFKNPKWKEVLDSLKSTHPEMRLTADVTVNGVKYNGVGVRYKGNSSYNNVKKTGMLKLPFNIKINYTDKTKKLPGGYTVLKLANGFRDPSLVREVLAYEIARNYVPAPKANFAKVYVNDTYLGLYTNTESIEGPFLDRHFGGHNGPIIKGDPDWTATRPSKCPESDKCSLTYLGEDTTCYNYIYEYSTPEAALDLVSFVRDLNKNPEKLDKLMDIDQALWMLAINNVLVNLDSYVGAFCQNYYLYKDTLGGIHPVLWDLNLAFGGFRLMPGSKVLNDEELKNFHLFVHHKEGNPNRPLITKLMANNLYRKMYLAHCRTLYRDYIENGLYLKRAKEWQAFIAPHVKEDKYKLYSDKAFTANISETTDAAGTPIIGISELMEARKEVLKNTPYLWFEEASIKSVTHEKSTAGVKVKINATGAQKVYVFWRKTPLGLYEKSECKAEPEGQYSLEVPSATTLQYYVVAEGEKSAACMPAKAGLEVYRL